METRSWRPIASAVLVLLTATPAHAEEPARTPSLELVDTIRGVLAHPPVPEPAPQPSVVARALLADHGIGVPPDVLTRLDRLDRPAVANALSNVLSAFRTYASIAAEGRWSSRELLDAKVELVASATALRDTRPAGGCADRIDTELFAISLGSCRDTYLKRHALVIDASGDDVYRNNAGGAAPPIVAAAVIDLDGNDQYLGRNYSLFGPGGANGGAIAGSGFLLDLAGDDRYVTNEHAVNGGAFLGAGFLVDAGGHDVYTSTIRGDRTAAAVNGGAICGHGFLMDLGGNDVYVGEGSGSNGAAGGVLFAWALSCTATGFLFDAAGNDRYKADAGITNGYGFLGVGQLIDRRGRDRYTSGRRTAIDETVVPKGAAGAQIDAP